MVGIISLFLTCYDIKKDFKNLFAKDQETKFESTVVLMLNQGLYRKRGVIVFWTHFLLLFWRSKKVNDNLF